MQSFGKLAGLMGPIVNEVKDLVRHRILNEVKDLGRWSSQGSRSLAGAQYAAVTSPCGTGS